MLNAKPTKFIPNHKDGPAYETEIKATSDCAETHDVTTTKVTYCMLSTMILRMRQGTLNDNDNDNDIAASYLLYHKMYHIFYNKLKYNFPTILHIYLLLYFRSFVRTLL